MNFFILFYLPLLVVLWTFFLLYVQGLLLMELSGPYGVLIIKSRRVCVRQHSTHCTSLIVICDYVKEKILGNLYHKSRLFVLKQHCMYKYNYSCSFSDDRSGGSILGTESIMLFSVSVPGYLSIYKDLVIDHKG